MVLRKLLDKAVSSCHKWIKSIDDCLFEIRKIAVFPLAFIAGWLQGHWWGFISRNYVVWPTFLLMNVFIALKGSHFWFLFEKKKTTTKIVKHLPQNFFIKILSLWPWPKDHVLGLEWYHIKFWTSFYHRAKHESIHERLHKKQTL